MKKTFNIIKSAAVIAIMAIIGVMLFTTLQKTKCSPDLKHNNLCSEKYRKEKNMGNNKLFKELYLSLNVTDKSYNEIPQNATKFTAPDDFIELENICGQEIKPISKVMVYGEFELEKEQKISLLVGADWYANVYLNGEKVFTTRDDNNISILNYLQCDIIGRKGKNLIAVEVIKGKASSFFLLKEGVKKVQKTDVPIMISGALNEITGEIKPMNAVNNSPIKGRKTQTRSNMKAWQEAKFPYSRNHDASFAYYPNIVDVHLIFPDFSRDPEDPSAYDFTHTDLFIKNTLEGGTDIFYRLGSKIEHHPKKYGTLPPPDFHKWAVICEHIIRHYNEGWANGFKYNIKYWEIWNEPDLSHENGNKKTWGGTDEEFFNFYRTAATYLKNKFPHLKIGGPASAGDIGFTKRFLKSISEGERVPLDFFSWHLYTNNPILVSERAIMVHSILNRYGYKNTESILDEWNYIRDWTDSFVYSIESIIGLKGAVFNAAMMCEGQNAKLDMMMYYDARPCAFNGIFDYYTLRPLKGYYSFLAWSKLAELGKQFKLDTAAAPGVYAVGATDGKGQARILVSRFFEQDDLPAPVPVTIKIDGVNLQGAKLYLVDDKHNFESVGYQLVNGAVVFEMKANTFIYMEK